MFLHQVHVSAKWLVLSLAGAVAMCLLGPLVLHVEGQLPITLQSLVILLWSIFWGWRIGVSATLLYLAAGAMGLPVFANGAGGLHHFFGATAGFLFAFPIAALVVGVLAEYVRRVQFLASAGLLFLGQLVLLMLGLPYQIAAKQSDTALLDALVGLLPNVLMKVALGTMVVVLVGRLASRQGVPTS